MPAKPISIFLLFWALISSLSLGMENSQNYAISRSELLKYFVPVILGENNMRLNENAKFSACGKYILTPIEVYRAGVLNYRDNSVREYRGHGGDVTMVSMSHDSKKIVTTSRDHTARVWDTFNTKCLASLWHDESIREAYFSPDDKWIITLGYHYPGSNGEVKIWDASSYTCKLDISGRGALINHRIDSKWLFATYYTGEKRAWNIESGECVDGFDPYHGSSSPPEVRVFDGVTYDVVSKIYSGQEKKALRSSKNDFIITYRENSIKIWDAKNDNCLKELNAPFLIDGVQLSPDDRWIVAIPRKWMGDTKIWDRESGTCVLDHNGNRLPVYLFSPDAKMIAIQNSFNVSFVVIMPPEYLLNPKTLVHKVYLSLLLQFLQSDAARTFDNFIHFLAIHSKKEDSEAKADEKVVFDPLDPYLKEYLDALLPGRPNND